MPIKHIVLFSFKSSLSKIEIDQVMQSIGDLKKVIPQVLSFSWGENNSPENMHKGFLHGFVMEFENANDRKTYLEHPQHAKVVKDVILPSLADGVNSAIVFDFNCD